MAAPLPLVAELQKDVTRRVAELDADLLAGLSRAGFRTDSGEDGGGMLMKFYGRGGGYYIDVGCSQLIIDGRIAVKQGVEVARLRPGEVVFTDGDTLLADLVVVAAGFGNMQDVIRTLFGAAVADRVGPVWGIGQDGELRGMWRRTGQPGLWITGSSFTQSRTMSRPLALQIAAQQRGMLPLAVPHDGSGMPRRGQEIRDQIETDSDVGSIDT
jgi:putative flavoprotein involved in K+ transport